MPAVDEIVHVGGVGLVVFLEEHVFLFECIGHCPDLEEEFIDSFFLVEEGAIQGVADVHDMGFTQGQEFLYRVVVVLAGEEQSEMGHFEGPESHLLSVKRFKL